MVGGRDFVTLTSNFTLEASDCFMRIFLMSAKDDFLRHVDRGREIYDQYGQYQRFRQMSLDDMLLENRIIFLIGEINYARATEVIMKMLYLDNLKKGREISLYINSPGGTVDDTLAIYDTMRFVGSPHAKIMLHQPWGGVTGQASDIKIQAEEILKAKQTINRILADHTGQALDKIMAETERDRYMTADEAKEYGLIDEVLHEEGQKPGEAKKDAGQSEQKPPESGK
jgi:ATP-dependent Clp protease protease subunit